MSLWGYVKAYWWVAAAAALVVLGYLVASSRMRVRALEMQVEALQALRDAKARRLSRDKAIDDRAASETRVIVDERDAAVAVLERRDDELDRTGADHDALDPIDDEVNAYLRGDG